MKTGSVALTERQGASRRFFLRQPGPRASPRFGSAKNASVSQLFRVEPYYAPWTRTVRRRTLNKSPAPTAHFRGTSAERNVSPRCQTGGRREDPADF